MSLDRQELDLAVSQGGILTRDQLLDLGRTDRWLANEVESGRLLRIKNGVFRALALDTHEDLLRAAVAALPRATVSHESAAHLLHFPVLPPLHPTVTVHAKTTHLFPGVTVRRNTDLQDGHTVRISGLRTTNVYRTLFDLAGVIEQRLLDEIVESLAIAGRIRIPRLGAFAQTLRRRGKPGSAAVMAVVEGRLAVEATKLERLGFNVLHEHGVPPPVLQYPAPWDEDERIDGAWPPVQLGVEWDSRGWHVSKERMRSDRRRDRQASLAGWVVLRYTWGDLIEDPDAVADEVLSLLKARSPNPRL